MSILKKAENKMAYFKAGIFGFQGSGKTFTATQIGIWICKAVNNPTLAYFATEPGHNFLINAIRSEGIEVFDVKSRAFDDLIATIKECEQDNISVLIIDSITHVWQELKEAYESKTKKKKLEFQDWAKVKGKGGWLDYADLFNNSKLHIIAAGRAGWDYDFSFNEDGSKDLIKTGTKMKAEAEFGFEPSLVLEMERLTQADLNLEEAEKIKNIQDRKRAKQNISATQGSKFIHRMSIMKDRANLINGQHFDFTGNVTWQQIFSCIEPHFKTLNIGGDHEGVDTTRNSEDRFNKEGNSQWYADKKRATIALEEIKAEYDKNIPGSTAKEKAAKIKLAEYLFKTGSWTALEGMSADILTAGLKRMRVIFAIPENTIDNIAAGKILEPPDPNQDIPEFKDDAA